MKLAVIYVLILVVMNANAQDDLSHPNSLKTTGGFLRVIELPVHDGMPDPFVKPDGARVKSKEEWLMQRVYLKATCTVQCHPDRISLISNV